MRAVSSAVAVIALTLTSIGPPAAHADGTLAEAHAIIASKKRADLTHAFGPDTPVWRGFGQATMAAASDLDRSKPWPILIKCRPRAR